MNFCFRNGHSKGIAFVEYVDEVAAAKALVKTDGMKVCFVLVREEKLDFNFYQKFYKHALYYPL